ncbi:TonB-dependent receptor [Lutibacter sp. TH_r2]|uniref:TonB-dependent receptor n=1 Tax=Lutibacter sp. TH_r2 TaxID=3082083 RepID=UPI002954059A|nr:TonB-dependent receptor [Lutibacter sp. TH_r2]MDV7188225.1 TonB-dependent receptor [Lutibacter sp. TH_r2]
MKKILVILFIGLNLYSYGQNKITGTITDINNEPLTGVEVYVEKFKKGTATDENGYFELSNIPNSTLKVTAHYMGYKTQVKTVNFTKPEIELNFVLKEFSYQIDEIVISTPFNKLQSENAIKVVSIKLNEIENSGSTTLTEAISSIPGVDMIAKGTGVAKPVIRGLSATNVLMLNNGVKMENFQFSENHPFIVDEFGVDHIEVIKGPASLLYGSDAVGGVINIIKEKPALDGKITGDFNTKYHTNTDGFSLNAGVKGNSNQVNWGIRTGYKNHADYEDGNGDYIPNTRFQEKSLKANIGLRKSFGVFNMYYDFNRPQLGMSVGNVKNFEKGRGIDFWYQDLTSHLISSRNTLFLSDYKVDVNLAYQLNNRKLQTDENTPAFEMVDMDLNTFSYEVKTHFPSTEKTEYVFGLQGSSQTNRNHEAPNHVIPDADVNDISVFGLLQHTFLEKLKTQVGLRYDYRSISSEEETNKEAIDNDYGNISGSLGATYPINDNFLLRANLASAYRTPNIAELTQNGYHGTRFEVGNPDLDTQRSYEADLSFHYHTKQLMIDVSGFYNRINDYIYIAPTSESLDNGDTVYQYSQTDSKLYGGEFIVNYTPIEWLNINTTYSYLIGKEDSGNYLPYIPQNKVRFDVKLQKEKIGKLYNSYFKIGGLLAEDQNNPSIYETETDGYFLLNAGIGTQLKIGDEMINVSIQANNLLNETYIDHLSTLKDLNYNNIGRNIVATIKIPFTIK